MFFTPWFADVLFHLFYISSAHWHRMCCLFLILDVLMHGSFVSRDAVPVNDYAYQHGGAAGPLSVGVRDTRAFGDNDGAPPVAENQLHNELCCVTDRRCIFVFEADAISLQEACTADCFRWLVDPSFSCSSW